MKDYIIMLAIIAIVIMSISTGVITVNKVDKTFNLNPPEFEEKIQLEYFTKITGKKDISEYSIKYTKMHGIDLPLFVALMKAESRFNPRAINLNIDPETNEVWSIDRGLCQLNSATFPYLTNSDFFNPEINIAHATKYFRQCLDNANNNTVKALAYYNAGIWSVKNKRIGDKTLNYINYILSEKERYEHDLNMLLREVYNNAYKK